MKILIVDDEFVSRKKAQKIMSQYGECDTAVNGAEALEAVRLAQEEGEPYDLITMDVRMPEMDGIEALKKIREWEKSRYIQFGEGVKVVMLTADKSSKSLFSSFIEFCAAYIVKPFNKEKLDRALTEIFTENVGLL